MPRVLGATVDAGLDPLGPHPSKRLLPPSIRQPVPKRLNLVIDPGVRRDVLEGVGGPVEILVRDVEEDGAELPGSRHGLL